MRKLHPPNPPDGTKERILRKPEESVVVVKVFIPRKRVSIFLVKVLKLNRALYGQYFGNASSIHPFWILDSNLFLMNPVAWPLMES
jgi:hypothetical protein